MASRVPSAMCRDRLMPAVLQRVHPGGTPVPALVASVVVLVCIATNTFNTVLAMLAFLFVANYALTFIALFASRHRAPDAPRPFRVPGYPLVPGVALAGSLAFMVAAVVSDRTNSMLSLALLGISWPVYLSSFAPCLITPLCSWNVPGKKPGTSTKVTSGMLNASQKRTKRAALRAESISRHPAICVGWLATNPTVWPSMRPKPVTPARRHRLPTGHRWPGRARYPRPAAGTP